MRKNQEAIFTADGINKCNKIMLSCAALLFIIGIIFVFEADRSSILSAGKGVRQIWWSAAGLVCALFFLLINYEKLAAVKFLKFFLTVLTAMLIFLAGCSLVNALGGDVRIATPAFSVRRINGAFRWIDLGFFNFQPSIFVQIFLILFIAAELAKIPEAKGGRRIKGAPPPQRYAQNQARKTAPNNNNKGLKTAEILKENYDKHKPLWLSLFIFTLVLVQPSTSVAISIMFTALAMFALKNSKILFGRNFFIILAVMFLAGVIAWHGFDHVRERILSGGQNFQSRQAVLAIGSGGLLGLGLGNSEAKHSRLPEIENDYIFSLIAEETGFVGALLFIGIYALFIMQGFLTSLRTQDAFGKLAAFGFTVNYAFAFLVHLFVNLGFISTGSGLPFVSYGGTAMIADSIALGILLNISGSHYERIRP